MKTIRYTGSALLTCALAVLAPPLYAAEPVPATAGTSTVTEAKLVTEFSSFLGGDQAAAGVVTGLRQGTAIDLIGEDGQTTTITPTTRPMGYGNVRITLRMAQAELNALGISQPTADQLSAVMLGGDINGTQVDGILAMRADGMGWGTIAQHYGTTVGQLMGKGTVKVNMTSPSTRAAPAGAIRANGYIPSSGGNTSGIVTGAGTVVDTGKDAHRPTKAGGQNAGVMSGNGRASGTAAGSATGKANAPGQLKRN